MDNLITVGEACEVMGLARSTIYNLISERKIGTVKIGKAVRIKTSDIAAYIEAHYRKPECTKTRSSARA